MGTRLGDGGRYEIRDRIGRGGMAEVFRAVDARLNNRLVAVKILSGAAEAHPHAEKLRTLFIEEARALARVRDDNVVAVLDSGAAADGTPFMVMEFLTGEDLAALLKREKQLGVERAIDIILAVGAGLHACHLVGVIHRDVKPANVFLAQTLKGEVPKLLDFSVAKIPIVEPGNDEETTGTDLVVGTPSYMSPEQAQGRRATALSDQYSLSALLYRCLTGRPPDRIVKPVSASVPDISAALDQAILRALHPEPDARFPTVHDFGKALEEHASPAERAKWNRYYSTPPLPLPAAYTGPIDAKVARAAVASVLGATGATEARSYDFGAHERTTNADSAGNTGGERGPSTLGADQRASDDRPSPSAVALKSDGERAGPSTEQVPASMQATSATTAIGERVRRASARHLVVAAAILILAVILATFVATRVTQRTPSGSPAPPEWRRAGTSPRGGIPRIVLSRRLRPRPPRRRRR